jgi:hypothetical protein
MLQGERVRRIGCTTKRKIRRYREIYVTGKTQKVSEGNVGNAGSCQKLSGGE